MKKALFPTVLSITCATVLVACNPESQSASDTRAADEGAIRQADIAWSKTAETKDLEGMLTYITEDEIAMAPNMPMVVGKKAILELYRAMFATPGFSLKWRPDNVEVARSGDIGYVRGTYETTTNDPKGTPMTDKGKYIEIWKKQADGSWKVATDIFNSDLPPQPAPSPVNSR